MKIKAVVQTNGSCCHVVNCFDLDQCRMGMTIIFCNSCLRFEYILKAYQQDNKIRLAYTWNNEINVVRAAIMHVEMTERINRLTHLHLVRCHRLGYYRLPFRGSY